MGAEARLKELGITLPEPGKPAGVYKPVVVVGDLAYTSGHIPYDTEGKLIAGRVGEDLDVAAGKVAARQVGLAILASLRNAVGSLDRVTRVVKILGMVNCGPAFHDQAAVINGCSELFRDVFGEDAGVGARSAVGMVSLPLNMAVEIEAIFQVQS